MFDAPIVEAHEFIAVDLETTGLKFWEDKAFAVAISTPDGKDYCLDLREPNQMRWAQDNLPRARMLVNQNLKFDLHFFLGMGIDLSGIPLWDTMVGAALIDEHLLKYDLDYLGMEYLGRGKDTDIYQELANIFGGRATRDAQAKNFYRAPWGLISKYAKQDTRTALDLAVWQMGEIIAQELGPVMGLEMDLLPVLVDIEHRGVRVDLDAADRAQKFLTEEIMRKQEKLDRLAGFAVNPNPSGSIHKLFEPKWEGTEKEGRWVLIDGTTAEKTDAGKASIDSACLERMTHPAAKLILSLRQMKKTKDTFINGHILGHHHRGVIHANFNQTKSDNDLGTGTGRLSCNSPALQQIHKRNKEIARVVRAIFLPDPGQLWNCRDYSQMDFRVFADYAANPLILGMYNNNPDMDFHQMVADMTGLPRSMTPGIKGNAKQINLGLVFGMGEGKLAQEMGLPHTVHWDERRKKEWIEPGDEALAVFEQYHSNVPGIKKLLAKASSVAKSRGFVRTKMGRRIRFPRGQFTHKAGGLIFQGSAADALKCKLVEVHRVLKGTDGRLLLNVHDEFDTSLPQGAEGQRLTAAIRDAVECFDGVKCPVHFTVPIRSTYGDGPNWWVACSEEKPEAR